MNEAFLRQRRNVFVVCTIILALCLGGVDLQELTFAGMKFSAFKRPEIFLVGVWFAYGYFVYRYLVYFLEWSPRQLDEVLWREMERAVSPRIRALVYSKYPDTTSPLSYRAFLGEGRSYKGQRQFRSPDGATLHLESFDMPIRLRETFWWELRGALRFIVLTPAFTEHVFPFAISAVTLFYCGFVADWKGSLSGLLMGQ